MSRSLPAHASSDVGLHGVSWAFDPLKKMVCLAPCLCGGLLNMNIERGNQSRILEVEFV